VTEPAAKAIYRIYRDTRFSKDKTPYKTHIAATFGRRGFRRTEAAGFYFGVSHKEVEIGGGSYMPEPEQLAAIRKKIDSDSKSLRKILDNKELKKLMGNLLGDKLSRVPKGFDPEHPAAEFLKMKQLYFYITLPASLATKSSLKAEVVKRF